MADLKERLFTKDKEIINRIYKRIKKYIIREKIIIKEAENTSKETKISYLVKAFENEKLIRAIMQDISLREFYDFDYMIDSKYVANNCASQYWIDLGVVYTCDEAVRNGFRFIDEFEAVFRKEQDELYDTLGYRAAINSCISAMVNLYGIITFEKAYEIFNEITSLGRVVPFGKFCECAISFADMREDFTITAYMNNFVSSEYVKISNRNGMYKVTPLPSYYELISKQGNKPFYTHFNVTSLFEYEYPGSYGSSEYIDEFYRFLVDNFDKDKFEIMSDVDEICIACRNEMGINDIFNMLNEKGLISKSQKLQKSLVCHIMEIKNNIRLRSNRGFSINEMRILSYDMDKACGSL